MIVSHRRMSGVPRTPSHEGLAALQLPPQRRVHRDLGAQGQPSQDSYRQIRGKLNAAAHRQAALARSAPVVDLEWAVRLALECRRRVKEQQKWQRGHP